MQSDKELLMLAAKAAGLEIDEGATPMTWDGYKKIAIVKSYGSYTMWSSLADDGDALRLAVKLDMGIEVVRGLGEVRAGNGSQEPATETWWRKDGNDEMAATRRAITRAAAALAQQGVSE